MSAAAPTGTSTLVSFPRSRRNVAGDKWSKWRCETRATSTLGRCSGGRGGHGIGEDQFVTDLDEGRRVPHPKDCELRLRTNRIRDRILDFVRGPEERSHIAHGDRAKRASPRGTHRSDTERDHGERGVEFHRLRYVRRRPRLPRPEVTVVVMPQG